MKANDIETLNKIVDDYFKQHPEIEWIPAKEVMPALLQNGVFKKDEKNGLPLRKALRSLEKEGKLNLIPRLHVERNEKNTFWYFVKEGSLYSGTDHKAVVTKKQRIQQNRLNSEENYVLNLCDEILQEKGQRQHTFGFLLGDVHRDGKTRTRLPVNAYYEQANLVVEYLEFQSPDDDTSEKMTVSGVSRAEQRKIYHQRKKEVFRKKQIPLVEIKYKDLLHDKNNQLLRDQEQDTRVIKRLLMKYLP